MVKMINGGKLRITKLLSACFFAFLLLTATNVSAATENTTSDIQPYAANKVYITETVTLSKNYTIPPATWNVTDKNIDGFLYSGTLNRFDDRDAADVWIVIYKGYVYAN